MLQDIRRLHSFKRWSRFYDLNASNADIAGNVWLASAIFIAGVTGLIRSD